MVAIALYLAREPALYRDGLVALVLVAAINNRRPYLDDPRGYSRVQRRNGRVHGHRLAVAQRVQRLAEQPVRDRIARIGRESGP